MTANTPQALDFVDLKSQYGALRDRIGERIQRVLDHGQYIMGPEVAELEARLAEYTGARHCITVSSGTEALLISLMALGLRPGDEVVTTPFSFAATAEVIVLLGARPVFVDIEPGTCFIDAARIEARITSRTRAILPVSLYGQCPDMDAIQAIASRHGLPVIEDAAQSFGATYRGRRSGHLSTLGCTSFFPSKPLGCYGDGGAIFTDDDALARACREIRVHGQSARYTHTRIGVGGRMDTLQCAVVLAKLERFEWEVTQRRIVARRYLDGLGAVATRHVALKLPEVRDDGEPVWAQFTVRVEQRDAVQAALAARGIPTAVHYPRPLHHQPAYAGLVVDAGDGGSEPCPHSVAAGLQVLSLPMSADLRVDQQDQVLDALREVLAEVEQVPRA